MKPKPTKQAIKQPTNHPVMSSFGEYEVSF